MMTVYLATYFAWDKTYLNPFGHPCIVISKAEPGKKIEIVDNWGYYAPPASDQKSFISKIKKALNLDVDFTGNHGWLKHEDIRYLDTSQELQLLNNVVEYKQGLKKLDANTLLTYLCGLNRPLWGTTFEITEDQFNKLKQKADKQLKDQEDALKEAKEKLPIPPSETKNFRNYAGEEYSKFLYTYELLKAKQENREPRLKKFEIILKFGWGGFNLRESYNCKAEAISLLDGILTKAQIARLTENGKHPTLARYSGKMERVYLHSSGPLHEHKKKTGECAYSRSMKDTDTKLYWTIPPQEIEYLHEETKKLFEVNKDYCDDIKDLVYKLQLLEWLFINATVADNVKNYKEKLIERIRQHYEVFSVIKEKKNEEIKNTWTNYFWQKTGVPRSKQEAELLTHINKGKALLNHLETAVLFDLRINPLANTNIEDETIIHPYEMVASYLKEKDKMSLCAILKKNYCDNSVNEDTLNELNEDLLTESKEPYDEILTLLQMINHEKSNPRDNNCLNNTLIFENDNNSSSSSCKLNKV